MSNPPSTPLPSAKRRRIDAANSTLKKPFRSPLLSRPPGSSTPAPPAFALPTPSSTKTNSYALATPSKTSETPTKHLAPTPRRTPVRRQLFATPSSADPELAAAQKKHTALLTEIRAIKESMETVTQALALEANPKGDEDLTASIRKWRLAARGAADTLFGIAGDKVNQLGGPGGDAWRGMMGGGDRGFKSFGWDEDEPKRENDDEDEGLGGEDEKEEEEEKEGEEWGMRLMLKTLGIPEKMLGWDNDGACWRSLEEMEEV